MLATLPAGNCASSAYCFVSVKVIEVMVPITHPTHQAWLDQVLEFDLSDDAVRWELQPDGEWMRRGPVDFAEGDAQSWLYRWVDSRQRR